MLKKQNPFVIMLLECHKLGGLMKVIEDRERIVANKEFTDRVGPLEGFWSRYHLQKENLGQGNLLFTYYYGIGGVGKSSLQRKFKKELETNITTPYYASFDFATSQDMVITLKSIRDDIISSYQKFNFSLFNGALGLYTLLAGVERHYDIKEIRQNNKEVFTDLLAVGDLIPVLSSGLAVGTFATKYAAKFIEMAKSKNMQRELIKTEYAEDVYKMLPRYFAQDFNQSLERIKPNEPFVFFLDTYEELVNELGGSGQKENDLWLRDRNGLLVRCKDSFWVICGRQKLRWGEISSDIDWREAERSNALEQHILGDLEKGDAFHFLEKAGILKDEMKDHIFKITNGTPVFLDFCVERYYDLLHDFGSVDVSQIDQTMPALVKRFLSETDTLQQDLIQLLSVIGKWNQDFVERCMNHPVLQRFFHGQNYERVLLLSFIKKDDFGYYYMHKTVQDIILSTIPSNQLTRFKEPITTIYEGIIKDSPNQDLSYHTAITAGVHQKLTTELNDQTFIRYYLDTAKNYIEDFLLKSQVQNAASLMEKLWAWLPNAQGNQPMLTLAGDYANILKRMGHLEQGMLILENALNLEPTEDDQLTSILTQFVSYAILQQTYEEGIRTLSAYEKHPIYMSLMVDLYTAKGEYQKALNLQKNLVAPEDNRSLIKLLMAMTKLYQLNQDEEKALNSLQKALELAKLDDDKELVLNLNRELLELQMKRDSSPELTMRLENHLNDLKNYYGEDHPKVVEATSFTGYGFYLLGDHAKGNALLDYALNQLLELHLEVSSFAYRHYVYSASIYLHEKQYQTCLEVTLKAYEIAKSAFKPTDRSYLMALYNVGLAYKRIGNNDLARQYYEKAYLARRRVYGDHHPDTIKAMNAYKGILKTTQDKGIERFLVAHQMSVSQDILNRENEQVAMEVSALTKDVFKNLSLDSIDKEGEQKNRSQLAKNQIHEGIDKAMNVLKFKVESKPKEIKTNLHL